ncbi:MAG: hypothetical protein JJE21_01835 [Spirochaetaceae bacterium]|nr:hypothetical protein [Spirochaetaceae bacterium]
MLKTINPHRGNEFSLHAYVTEWLDGIRFYFPFLTATGERGTNENTNGLLGEYIPKKADINGYTVDELIC